MSTRDHAWTSRPLTVKDTPAQLCKGPQPKQPQRRLQVFCHNVGGLGSGMYEDLMGFLDQSHYDIALAQETKLRADSEYVTPNWICVGSGTESQKQAGVMILIRKTITDVREVRHDAIVPGRLLRALFLEERGLQAQCAMCVSACMESQRRKHSRQEGGVLV